MVCARECPDWCITITGHRETVPSEREGRRPVTTTVLDRFEIDWSLCLYCGICVEVCPYDALSWQTDFSYATREPGGLVHDRERLAGWSGNQQPGNQDGPERR
jgi:NADH-quinone oxidoreductase subunit I